MTNWRLLGHLIGDGCTLPRHVMQYTTREHVLAEEVARLATAVFGDAVTPRISQERTWYQVYLAASGHLTHNTRNPVAAWLDDLGVFGLRSYEKRVPEKVFAQPAAGIARFLRHLWATDGCIHLSVGKHLLHQGLLCDKQPSASSRCTIPVATSGTQCVSSPLPTGWKR